MRSIRFLLFLALLSLCWGQVPLMDLGLGTYQGFQGGLYEGGLNIAPADHDAAGIAAGQTVNRTAGVLVVIGMSNTRMEACETGGRGGKKGGGSCAVGTFFQQVRASAAFNQGLRLVNCAANSQPLQNWTGPASGNNWSNCASRIAAAGASEADVQVVWHKNTLGGPQMSYPSLPAVNAAAYAYISALGQVFRNMRARYPNLKQAFYSSRIQGRTCLLSPEPYAYEDGFGTKWFVQAQIEQRRTGQIDPLAGDLSGPWVGWSGYLWANYNSPPRSDGLVWVDANYSDACHPSQSGWTKVAIELMEFFLGSPYTPWFRN